LQGIASHPAVHSAALPHCNMKTFGNVVIRRIRVVGSAFHVLWSRFDDDLDGRNIGHAGAALRAGLGAIAALGSNYPVFFKCDLPMTRLSGLFIRILIPQGPLCPYPADTHPDPVGALNYCSAPLQLCFSRLRFFFLTCT
jgi:hypothetical protein